MLNLVLANATPVTKKLQEAFSLAHLVEQAPLRATWEIQSALLVQLELLFLMVEMTPQPQTQILVFVEQMLS